MSSLIGRVEIPQYLSTIEEEAAKIIFIEKKEILNFEDHLEIAYYKEGVKLAYAFQSFLYLLLFL